MADLGLELCDTGLQATFRTAGELTPWHPEGAPGPLGWMGLAFQDGRKCLFGRPAEDGWFVHPRHVCHNFLHRLGREASALSLEGKTLSFSQLAYFFLRDYYERLVSAAGAPEKIVLAVPGAYLKDSATEDEKIGLLLGMARELELPLASVIDLACAAVCDPRLEYFDRTLPMVLVDVHLHGAEITLLRHEERFVREDYACLPQAGYTELLRRATTAMGNRFLRHTTFDILEDGHIEQAFYRQTKEFLLSGAAEFHYQINTGSHAYELSVTNEQLTADTAAFVQSLVQGTRALLQKSTVRAEPCTVALTDRAGLLPGVTARFRAAGFTRLLRLPAGAAAAGAACIATGRTVPADLADVPVESVSPITVIMPPRPATLSVRLIKSGRSAAARPPTHAICQGFGEALDGLTVFTLGTGPALADLVLPEEFTTVGDGCGIRLELKNGQWWLLDQAPDTEALAVIEAGDRLALRYGSAETEILFAWCPAATGFRRARA